MKKSLAFILVFFPFAGLLFANDSIEVVRINRQHSFRRSIPAGNYSGIAYLGGNKYVVANDKSPHNGFCLFQIDVDSVTGDIVNGAALAFYGTGERGKDQEAIAYFPDSNSVFIAQEEDNRIREYTMDGKLTGRELNIPATLKDNFPNYGFESLTYNATTRLFWTCNESTLYADGDRASSQNGVRNRIRLQAFDETLQPVRQYAYLMDQPTVSVPTSGFALGVSELTALDDGRLLVLERELYIPTLKIRAAVNHKLYVVDPTAGEALQGDQPLNELSPYLPKQKVAEWKTKFSLFNNTLGNYEGMCLGPRLKDGSQVLIVIADSQNQYAGLLRDWLKTIVIK